MAQVTGRVCDVCKSFSLEWDDWLKLSSFADKDDKRIEICSNKCLLKLAKDRSAMGAEEKRTLRTYRKWDDEQKLEIIAYADTHGAEEAGRKFDLSSSLVRRWVKEIGGASGETA